MVNLLFELHIESCRDCLLVERFFPSNLSDNTDFVCTKANYRIIAENVEYENESSVEVPNWCPLR